MKKNLLILLMISSLTYADEYKPDWIPISEGEKGGVYFDKNSLHHDEKGRVLVWMRAIKYNPERPEPIFDTLYVTDCKIRKSGIASMKNYDLDGRVVNQTKLPTDYAPMWSASESSFAKLLLTSLCDANPEQK
mgnify:CR=1 FL=1